MNAVSLPGGRDARGTLDRAGDARGDAVVVAAPPHPRHGGRRTDERLRAVSGALGERGVDCLRFDYGPWAEGRGERKDVQNALRWAHSRYDRVGAFGYSFGASVTLLAVGGGDERAVDDADATDATAAAVSVLAPAATLSGMDAAGAVAGVDAPLQVVVGERDETVDWRPVAEAARARGADVVTLPADHYFVGQAGKVADAVTPFLVERLG